MIAHAVYTATVTAIFAVLAVASYGSAVALTALFVAAVCGPACWRRARADFRRYHRHP